jgi:hypothetical protein
MQQHKLELAERIFECLSTTLVKMEDNLYDVVYWGLT